MGRARNASRSDAGGSRTESTEVTEEVLPFAEKPLPLSTPLTQLRIRIKSWFGIPSLSSEVVAMTVFPV
jgi:hypothetical protein